MKRSTVTVRELVECGEAELTTGPFGTQLKAAEYVCEGTPVINVRNIGFGEIRGDNPEFVGEETVSRLSRHLLLPNDIVFGRKGAVERHAFISSAQAGWLQGSDCLRMRLSGPRYCARFVSYCLLTPHHKQWMINLCSHGATMASLNQDILGRIELPVVDPVVQVKIVGILSAYDDLIENNTRRIKLLEEIAQAIYREWFVEFRYPGHEDVPLVDSELGPIPEAWDVASLAGVLERHIGGGWGSEQADARHVHVGRVIRGTDIPRVNLLDLSTAPLRFHEASNLGKRVLVPGDIVMEVSGGSSDQPVGRVAYISSELLDASDVPTMCASFCKLLRVGQRFSSILVYWHLRELYDSREIEQYQTQSTGIKNLRFSHLAEVDLLPVPDPGLQAQFEEITAPMMSLVATIGRANTILRQSRDLLLPLLISGELDVSDLDIGNEEPAA